jgi:hypothetical protein
VVQPGIDSGGKEHAFGVIWGVLLRAAKIVEDIVPASVDCQLDCGKADTVLVCYFASEPEEYLGAGTKAVFSASVWHLQN